MYFWNTKKLAEDIKSNSVTQNEEKKYYIVSLILIHVSLFSVEQGAGTDTMISLVSYALLMLVSITWIKLNYGTNKGDKGKNFIGRVVMLGIPISIKVILLYFIIIVFVSLFTLTLSAEIATIEKYIQYFMLISSVLLTNLIYYRINSHLKYINS